MAELRTETMTVNMGPQHPSTHGVLRLVLEVDGETVRSARPTIGYLHTGIEKTAEDKTYLHGLTLTDRMDYLNPLGNNLAYCLAIEKLFDCEIPERATVARVLLAELTRINSHLVWLGTGGLDLGATSILMYCFREREKLLDLFEWMSGARMMTSFIRPGGLADDLEPRLAAEDHPQSRPDQLLVVDEHHRDRHEATSSGNRACTRKPAPTESRPATSVPP